MAARSSLPLAVWLGLLLHAAAAAAAPGSAYSSAEAHAADFAIAVHNRLSGSAFAYKVLAILSDSAQMVPPARVKFSLTVTAARTVCRNEPGVEPKTCSLQDPEHPEGVPVRGPQGVPVRGPQGPL
uniref:Cystatin domain-containing protein n=1 Tax=Myripristis murdjan TaxID=586833 RepID=A0A667XZI5_9TELE